MNTKKKILISLLFIAILGGGALFYVQNTRTTYNVPSQKQEQASKITASLKVGDNAYQVSVPAGSSVYDLMQEAAKTTKFSFAGKQFGGLGFFVDEINGVKQDAKSGEYWIYYVNNQKARVGVSWYILKPNDVISWKYEKASD